MYLFVKGHMSWNKVFILAGAKRVITNIWCLKGQLIELLLDQLLRYQRLVPNPYSGASGQSITIPVVQCLG